MTNVEPTPECSVGWTDGLLVGVDSIDEDHQAFFRLADMLDDLTDSLDESLDLLVETAINILEEYVEGHFLREERALAAVNYPFLAEHIAAHDAFAKRAHEIAQEYRDGNRDVAKSITDIVRRWIVGHIRTMDMQYRTFLTNDNVDNRPLVFLGEEP